MMMKWFKIVSTKIDEDALKYFSTQSHGDVSALNALELAVLSAKVSNNQRHVTLEDAKDCLQKVLLSVIKMVTCIMMS